MCAIILITIMCYDCTEGCTFLDKFILQKLMMQFSHIRVLCISYIYIYCVSIPIWPFYPLAKKIYFLLNWAFLCVTPIFFLHIVFFFFVCLFIRTTELIVRVYICSHCILFIEIYNLSRCVIFVPIFYILFFCTFIDWFF